MLGAGCGDVSVRITGQMQLPEQYQRIRNEEREPGPLVCTSADIDRVLGKRGMSEGRGEGGDYCGGNNCQAEVGTEP